MDAGFSNTEGIVAMALTSHPDFDDTPLWDEDNDRNYENDGVIWHPHWVVLTEDSRVAGGLAVKQFDPDVDVVTLPPTNPGMPMYMDSPGHPVVTKGNTIRVIIPAYRVNNKTQFSFDAVTAYMQVNASNPDYPMLGGLNNWDKKSIEDLVKTIEAQTSGPIKWNHYAALATLSKSIEEENKIKRIALFMGGLVRCK